MPALLQPFKVAECLRLDDLELLVDIPLSAKL